MSTRLESGLIGAQSIAKRTGSLMLRNMGALIASLTVIICCLLLFVDIRFFGLNPENFIGSLGIMSFATYLMYFSLEDSGERLGEESSEFLKCRGEYLEARSKIGDGDLDNLRSFCMEYTKKELSERRMRYLLSYGLSAEEYSKWLSGEKFSPSAERVFKRTKKMKQHILTAHTLLSGESCEGSEEPTNPARGKILKMFLKLLPSTLCIAGTVSVMLTLKEGLNAASVIEGIIKLAALPIAGFRGYSSGYNYIMQGMIPWVEYKTRLIKMFKATAGE